MSNIENLIENIDSGDNESFLYKLRYLNVEV